MWPARCASWARTDWLVGAQQSGMDTLLQTPGVGLQEILREEVCGQEQC